MELTCEISPALGNSSRYAEVGLQTQILRHVIHISIERYGEVLRSEICATFKLTIFAFLPRHGNHCHIDKTKLKNVFPC